MIKVACDCGQRYQLDDNDAGRTAKCQCGRRFAIPGEPRSGDTMPVAGRRYETAILGRSSPMSSPASPPLPAQLGQYFLQHKLGAGAMGEVWRARDSHLQRDVALKILPGSISGDEERLNRFRREAQLAAQLRSSHVVTVYQWGSENGLAFIAMELVEGGTWNEYVAKHGPLTWREATRVIREAAAGLSAAHTLGIVHRDIKPGNLLRTMDGDTKVADFGLARTEQLEMQLTKLGSVMGTPSYMAPEQWQGLVADQRSDLYSLTCSYYFLLTGKAPFEAPNFAALGYQHRYEDFPDPRREVPDVPQQVVSVLGRGTQKDPGDRYQSARELLEELDAMLFPSPPSRPIRQHDLVPQRIAEAATTVAVTWQRMLTLLTDWCRRIPRVGWIAAGGGAVLLLLAIVFFVRTPLGTVRIEVSDPQIEVSVDSAKITLLDKSAEQRMKVGGHQLAVLIQGVAVPLSERPVVEVDGQTRRLQVQVNGATLRSGEFNVVRDQLSVVAIRLLTPDDGKDQKATDQETDSTSDKEQTALTARAHQYCFVENDWESGLPLLARSSDSTLRTLAEKELEKPTDAGTLAQLGDGWWQFGEGMDEKERKPYRQRARFWYLRALAQAQVNEKTELEKQIRQRLAAAPAKPAELRIIARGVDGSHDLRISNTEIRSTYNSYGWPKGTINRLDWDPRSGQIIKNFGATRFLSEVVDFSTAKISERQIGSHGKLYFLKVAEDHVLIKMLHSPGGKCDFIYTVTFEN